MEDRLRHTPIIWPVDGSRRMSVILARSAQPTDFFSFFVQHNARRLFIMTPQLMFSVSLVILIISSLRFLSMV